MALSDVAKKLFMKKYYTFSANLTNQDDGVIGGFIPPENGVIIEIAVGYATEAGTTPSLQANVVRGSTVLGSAAATAAATPVCEMVEIPIRACEYLSIEAVTANADNDFTGIGITLAIRVPFEEE